MIRILGLDAGLTLGYACFKYDAGELTLGAYGVERFPGDPKGNAGKEDVQRWARSILERFATADEVARDAPILLPGMATNRPALGAFAAADEFAMARNPAPKGGKVFGQTSRLAYARRVFLLADMPFSKSTVDYRAALVKLTGHDLRDTRGEKHHALDAIGVGIWHAYTRFLWHPEGWQDPKLTRRKAETAAWLKACSR